MTLELLLAQFDGLIQTPADVEKLNATILQWAIEGRLLPQSEKDEPASALIREIAQEKKSLIAQKSIPKPSKVPKVKDEEIPFDLPKNWLWTRAMEVCTYIQRGKSPKYSEIQRIPVISQKCVQWSGFEIEKARFILPKSLEKYQDYRFLQDGDLLWNSTGKGTLGRIIVYREQYNPFESAVADSHVTILRPSSFIDSDFLFIWFASRFVQSRIDSISTGSTKQTELGTIIVKEHIVPLAPLAEQKRIVARVDELLGQTAVLAQQLASVAEQRRGVNTAVLHQLTTETSEVLQTSEVSTSAVSTLTTNFDHLYVDADMIAELKQAILQLAVQGRLVPQDERDENAAVLLARIAAKRQKLIKEKEIRKFKLQKPEFDNFNKHQLPKGWIWCSLSDIILYLQTGPFGSNLHKSEYVEDGTPVINPSDMRDGKIVAQGAKMIGPKTLTRLSSYKLNIGDIILARRGEMGRCAAVTAEEEGWLCGTGSLILRLTSHNSQQYLIMLIQSETTRAYLRGGSVGATMSNLNQKLLLKMPVALPPYNEQKRIVAKVDELFALCDQLAGQLTTAGTSREQLLEAVLTQAT